MVSARNRAPRRVAKAGSASDAGMRATVAAPIATARGPIDRSVSIARKPNTPPGPRMSRGIGRHLAAVVPQEVHLSRDDDEHLVGRLLEGVVDEGAVVEPLDPRRPGDARRAPPDRASRRAGARRGTPRGRPAPRRSCCHSTRRVGDAARSAGGRRDLAVRPEGARGRRRRLRRQHRVHHGPADDVGGGGVQRHQRGQVGRRTCAGREPEHQVAVHHGVHRR